MTIVERMPLEALDRAMREMAPLTTLDHRIRIGLTGGFALGRVSAFPKLAESVDELEVWVDHESAEVLNMYRGRFRQLVRAMGRDQAVYCHHHCHRRAHPQDCAMLVNSASPNAEIAQALTESCGADLFVPSMSIVLLGHDDFGCRVIACRSRPDTVDWLARIAALSELHLLIAVDEGAGSYRWVRHGNGLT